MRENKIKQNLYHNTQGKLYKFNRENFEVKTQKHSLRGAVRTMTAMHNIAKNFQGGREIR